MIKMNQIKKLKKLIKSKFQRDDDLNRICGLYYGKRKRKKKNKQKR